MTDKKSNILAFGNKEFNNSLIELKDHFNFNLEITDDLKQHNLMENYQPTLGCIALSKNNLKKLISIINKNTFINII